jgi:hypothetical protein
MSSHPSPALDELTTLLTASPASVYAGEQLCLTDLLSST